MSNTTTQAEGTHRFTSYLSRPNLIGALRIAFPALPPKCGKAIRSINEGKTLAAVITQAKDRLVQVTEFRQHDMSDGKPYPYEQLTTKYYYTQEPWPDPIPRRMLGAVYLVNAVSRVIDQDKVYFNTGMGWVEMRDAEEQDYYLLPTVSDPR